MFIKMAKEKEDLFPSLEPDLDEHFLESPILNEKNAKKIIIFSVCQPILVQKTIFSKKSIFLKKNDFFSKIR